MKLSQLLLGSLLGLACLAAPVGAQQAPRVAIANTARILNELQETKDLNQKIQNDLTTLEAERKIREQKVKDLQAVRDALKSDSPQFAEKNKEWMNENFQYQIWIQMQKTFLESEQKRQMKQLFDKIEQTVAEVATQKGIDLVLAEQRTEVPENLDAITVDQLKAVIGQRNVLHHSAAVDLTNDIITAMDAKYKSGR